MQPSLLHRGMALALALKNSLAGGVIEESTLLKPLPVRSRRRHSNRYVDSAGMPHGSNGDKMVRKAMTGQVGLIAPRGWLHAWSSAKVASMGLGKRRRGT